MKHFCMQIFVIPVWKRTVPAFLCRPICSAWRSVCEQHYTKFIPTNDFSVYFASLVYAFYTPTPCRMKLTSIYNSMSNFVPVSVFIFLKKLGLGSVLELGFVVRVWGSGS